MVKSAFILSSLVSVALAYDQVLMLCLVNKERVSRGLSTLGLDMDLTRAAQWQSDYQAQRRTMTHTGSGGSSPSDRISKAGYDWSTCGENVAYGYPSEKKCMQEWMNSPGHRANILGKKFTHFGSAVSYRGSTPYYTQDFGGDNKRHNFPVCPSRGGYGGNYGGDNYGNDGGHRGYDNHRGYDSNRGYDNHRGYRGNKSYGRRRRY